eukprot:612058-Pelagomonas_calceolata.AAC.2
MPYHLSRDMGLNGKASHRDEVPGCRVHGFIPGCQLGSAKSLLHHLKISRSYQNWLLGHVPVHCSGRSAAALLALTFDFRDRSRASSDKVFSPLTCVRARAS